MATSDNVKNLLEMKAEAEEEEEEDLFEIDLEAIEFPNLNPTKTIATSTATANTLLANCLLPISDVSSAIPMVVALPLLSLPCSREWCFNIT